MRSRKLPRVPHYHSSNDMRDWYVIAIIALSTALFVWVPVLSGVRF